MVNEANKMQAWAETTSGISSLNTPFQVGFIGGAKESAVGYVHQIACQMDGRWQVVAGCFSQRETVNKETGAAWQIDDKRIYKDYLELIENEKGSLDAVFVLTPTPSHCSIVVDLLNAGFSVICEKALASSCEDVERIIATQKRTKQFLAVTFNYSGYPMVREIRSLVESGELGKIQQIQIEMPQESFARVDPNGAKPKPQAWRLQDGEIPTVSLDLGVHLHHLVYFLTGSKPVDVVATQQSLGWFKPVIDTVNCIVNYDAGFTCQMWYGKAALGARNGLKIRVFGESASVEWYQLEPEELLISYLDGRRVRLDRASTTTIASLSRYNRFKAGHPAGFIEAFANLYVDIADCLEQYQVKGSYQSNYVFGAGHAWEGLQLFKAVDTSAKTQSWQSLGEASERLGCQI